MINNLSSPLDTQKNWALANSDCISGHPPIKISVGCHQFVESFVIAKVIVCPGFCFTYCNPAYVNSICVASAIVDAFKRQIWISVLFDVTNVSFDVMGGGWFPF